MVKKAHADKKEHLSKMVKSPHKEEKKEYAKNKKHNGK